jgi:hypothetical protein
MQRRLLTGKRRGLLSAPCLSAGKRHILATTNDMIAKVRRHNYLLSQMVPAMQVMHMVATSRFRYSAPLVPWIEAELDKLHAYVHRTACTAHVPQCRWGLPGGTPRGTRGAGTR